MRFGNDRRKQIGNSGSNARNVVDSRPRSYAIEEVDEEYDD